jgi:hypothetical protein
MILRWSDGIGIIILTVTLVSQRLSYKGVTGALPRRFIALVLPRGNFEK